MSPALARGDIVLVPFPFTDLSSKKVRPSVVVNVLDEDVLLAFISSVASSPPSVTDFILTTDHPDVRATRLKAASTFRLSKLICLHRSLILRRLGEISPAIQSEIDKRLALAVGLA